MIFDIHQFDSYRENNRLEAKKAKGGLPSSLWETYSSFANCYGGEILLGVCENPDGSFYTTGLKNEASLKKDLWDCLHNSNKVSTNLLVERDVAVYEKDGDIIIAITVPKADRSVKPVYINGDIWSGTYRRDWEGDYHCSREEIKAMLRDQPENTMDMIVLDDFSLDDLSQESVQGYRNYRASVKSGHVWEKLSNDDYLEKIGAAAFSKNDGKLHPTAAGLLMFGEEYRIVRYFPEYFLDYREQLNPSIRWTDRIQSSSGDWSGNLFDFFFRVYNKLTRDLEKPFDLDGVARVEDTPVHKAIREALANCLINTDFYLPRGVVILKDQNQIVMQNPGSIRTGKDQMLRGGISDPRNKAIMKMLNLISIGERAGSGVPDIFSVWNEKGWIEPDVQEQYNPDRTILTLAFVKKQGIKTRDKKQGIKTEQHIADIIEYLEMVGEAGTAEIAEHINLGQERTRVILKNMENIEASGNNKNRKYRLKTE